MSDWRSDHKPLLSTAAPDTEESNPRPVPSYLSRSYLGSLEESVRMPGRFVKSGSGFDSVEWETRSAEIVNPNTGEKVFSADDLEFPKEWSQNCTALVSEKYFRTIDGVREKSVREMIDRVAGTITNWGLGVVDGTTKYFTSPDAADTFRNELTYILVNQMAAFNSPVWFNVGTKHGEIGAEQASACFINSLDDDMSSILKLAATEGRLYKGGSGSGVNYSALRSSREALSGGGFASGPVPFLAKDDANAGAIKSGGTTRRAAKMAILNADHGDILEFVNCKSVGERAAQALVDAGFSSDFRDRWGAYSLVPFQNANHSVRCTDAFMDAVQCGESWDLMARDGKTVLETLPAQDVYRAICKAAHVCGDPGLQFDTTINKWHTSPSGGRINGSNPCSEFMYLDDSACNLASINLLKFLGDGEFQVDDFVHTVDVLITAMDILVGVAGYPTEQIEANSHKFRPLGLGFTNLGAFLMAQGIPYDSNKGRGQAGAITALLSGRGYAMSARLAKQVGPFSAYDENKASMHRVLHEHAIQVPETSPDSKLAEDVFNAAGREWANALQLGKSYGYRNGQISVIAPAGTISFLMDADTTGIEPELSLVKTKKLVGGGTITIANQQIGRALDALEYDPTIIESIEDYVVHNGTVNGSLVKDEHLPVFDTSFPESYTGRSLRPEAHIHMMAAVQPFVSGAISKTCNIPNDATENDIAELYMLAWELGLKSIALYRDGSKRTQPLQAKQPVEVESQQAPEPLQVRKKLPNDCVSHRHKFSIGGHEGYLHVGMYPDGTPGEVFIKMSKEGSTIGGLMDAFGVVTSIALQYGVPLSVLVDKFSYTQFEPAGITGNESVRFAKSPLDYIFRWMESEFIDEDEWENDPPPQALIDLMKGVDMTDPAKSASASHGGTCQRCGNPAQRAGACMTCATCGHSEGCG